VTCVSRQHCSHLTAELALISKRSAASRPHYRSSGSGGVAMDSLPAHKVPGVKELIEAFGATVQ
jgi:hypothetical protein